MFTRNDVYAATHESRHFGWGYSTSVVINDREYDLEWVESGRDDVWADYSRPLLAVFKVVDDGRERYFAQEGCYRSHYGTEWDGPFYECEPKQVEITKYERI